MRTRHFSSSDSVPSPLDSARGKSKHQSVLLHEVIGALDIQPGDTVVDATLGGAGHAQALVKGLGGNGLFIGFDADSDALERARSALADSKPKVLLIRENFRNIESELKKRDVNSITKALFDLGWSSYQLDSGRGFSFMANEPLLMTYGNGEEMLTAKEIVNTWSEESIADIIFGFGEERYARRIAKAIIARRQNAPFETSQDLVEVIRSAVPAFYRRRRIHPATRTFQALRIAVNDELDALKEGLAGTWSLLAPGGRIAVISFHSLEDRIVKQMFGFWHKDGQGECITRKPIRPSVEESGKNPRARSAKLRVIKKISHESSHTKNKQTRTLDFSGKA